MFEKEQRFSIRKLTVGAASIVIGAAFIGMAGQTVHADETTQAPAQQMEQTKQAKTIDQSKDINNTSTNDINTDVSTDIQEEVHFYFHSNDNDNADSAKHNGTSNYYVTLKHQMNGKKDASGKITWEKTTVPAISIKDLMGRHDFINNATGIKGQSLPDLSKYVPVLTHPQVMGKDDDDVFGQIFGWIKSDQNDHLNLPSYSLNSPLNVNLDIHMYEPVQTRTGMEVDVYLPGNNNDTTGNNGGKADYYQTLADITLNGYVDDDGNRIFNSVNIPSYSIADILKNNNWVDNVSGYGHKSLPTIPDGYVPVVTVAKVAYDHEDEAASEQLFSTLNEEVKKGITILPGFTSDKGLRVIYNIHFEKNTTDTPSTTPAQPTEVQPTQPTKPTQPTVPAPVQPVTPETPAQPTTSNDNDDNNDKSEVAPVKSTDNKSANDSGKQVKRTESVRPHATKTVKADKVAKAGKAAVATKSEAVKASLPQTGAKKSDLGIIGLAIASLAGILGLAADKKRED